MAQRIMISVYRKGETDDFPKIVEDVNVDGNPKVSTLKAKATRLLRKHTEARMGKWKLSREYKPEFYRDANESGAKFQVRIHRRNQ